MSFVVRVSCRSCDGDEHGCWDGGAATLEDRFDTREEAEAAASELDFVAAGAPWDFEVIEVSP